MEVREWGATCIVAFSQWTRYLGSPLLHCALAKLSDQHVASDRTQEIVQQAQGPLQTLARLQCRHFHEQSGEGIPVHSCPRHLPPQVTPYKCRQRDAHTKKTAMHMAIVQGSASGR